MEHKDEVLPGTLNLMVLKTLEMLGPLHGYGIARRIEQINGHLIHLNQGTIYPALLHLEQAGWTVPSGACQKTIAELNITRSPERAGSGLPLRKRTGGEHPK